MKVIVYNNICKLNKCINLIAIYENGLAHNKTSYAYYSPQNSIKCFYYNNKPYNNISQKSWTKQVKYLKRQEHLKIFI